MRRLGFALAALTVVSIAGRSWGQAPEPQLSLLVDPLGTAFMSNDSAAEVAFDGYQILSSRNLLSPKNWVSIADQASSNPAHVIATLGRNALTFGEANPMPNALNELNIMGPAVLAPGAQFGLGYPFAQPVGPNSGLRFVYKPLDYHTGIDAPVRFLAPPSGRDLRLLVAPDGAAWLENQGDAPVSFDGYQIASAQEALDPAGWRSIADYLTAGLGDDVAAALGAGGLGFRETTALPGHLTELNAAGQGILPPGGRFDLGHPFQPGAAPEGVSFYYRLLGAAQSQQGHIVSVPEPSGLILLGLAAAGLLRGRRRMLLSRHA